jgi:hypothetical protein
VKPAAQLLALRLLASWAAEQEADTSPQKLSTE